MAASRNAALPGFVVQGSSASGPVLAALAGGGRARPSGLPSRGRVARAELCGHGTCGALRSRSARKNGPLATTRRSLPATRSRTIVSSPVSPSSRPSGDQTGSRRYLALSSVRPVPSVCTYPTPSRALGVPGNTRNENAMRPPIGDHSGPISSTVGLFVTRRSSVRLGSPPTRRHCRCPQSARRMRVADRRAHASARPRDPAVGRRCAGTRFRRVDDPDGVPVQREGDLVARGDQSRPTGPPPKTA
jgi:hypothetical protein